MCNIHRSAWACVLALGFASVAGAAPDRVSLVDAAKAGDVAHVAALLKQGRDVNATAPDGTTALHWVAYREDVATLDLLLRAGARVNAPNRYGATPLFVACTNGNGAVVERLLQAGADANATLPSGETALMTASRSGSAAAVTSLLSRGANVDAREPTRGQTALMWAAAEGHAAVITALVGAGADLRAKSRAPAGANVTFGFGMHSRNSKRIDAFTPLVFAVQAGRMDAVRTLLDLGADVNETAGDGTSALVIAAANAHWELGAYLLERGGNANASEQGWTPLHQLIRTRNLNIGHMPHPEATGRLSSLDLADKLIAHGANLNARITKPIIDGYRSGWNQMGVTPFLQAAKGADSQMMRLLAAHGADPNVMNERGTTPVMAAAGVEMLNPNEDSGTAEEALEAVRVALDLGDDVNAANSLGDTALHGAAFRGYNPLVELLVSRGAKLDVKNKAGLTPLRVANGEEVGRVTNVNTRPWTVELLTKLLTERGLPVEMKSGEEKERILRLCQPESCR